MQVSNNFTHVADITCNNNKSFNKPGNYENAKNLLIASIATYALGILALSSSVTVGAVTLFGVILNPVSSTIIVGVALVALSALGIICSYDLLVTGINLFNCAYDGQDKKMNDYFEKAIILKHIAKGPVIKAYIGIFKHIAKAPIIKTYLNEFVSNKVKSAQLREEIKTLEEKIKKEQKQSKKLTETLHSMGVSVN